VGAGVLYYLLGGHTEVQHVHASLRVAPAANGLSLGIEGTL
jgi:hypothetical protein